jgi:hypothetical protein
LNNNRSGLASNFMLRQKISGENVIQLGTGFGEATRIIGIRTFEQNATRSKHRLD